MTEPFAVGVDEAARMAGISPRLAWDLVGRREFPSFLLGNRRLVSVEGLREWMKRRTLESLENEDSQPQGPRLAVEEEAHGPRRRRPA